MPPHQRCSSCLYCVSVPRMLCPFVTSSLQQWQEGRSPGSSGSCQGLCWSWGAAAGSPAIPFPLGPQWELHRVQDGAALLWQIAFYGEQGGGPISLTWVSGDQANRLIFFSLNEVLSYLIVFFLKRVSRQRYYFPLLTSIQKSTGERGGTKGLRAISWGLKSWDRLWK